MGHFTAGEAVLAIIIRGMRGYGWSKLQAPPLPYTFIRADFGSYIGAKLAVAG